MSDFITITLNGEHFSTAAQTTLSSLVEQLGMAQGRIAIERNREIVPRSEHAATALENGDVIEIVHAIGGG
ncbi:thiamine biosynthesis protein ThiS [gamma proteobacterium HTCC5015]|nr:thiamine biosynthesis protein ThiS [gamma proteobacterium HTCC5015]